ncbi:hypothetical protein KY290_027688 [Solanum tuberosum]|uniref:BED-type domain-containing protein n=1 Tax=Solanum tuberosum TaxID=4113 RepID=A0ABQ7UFS0_SOLTU|nr:hypothetical protein KY285_026662 [Solanum tuberosum]KAH0748456.1 hypothetical protein KY290_027688 [Solanum tuberosum]
METTAGVDVEMIIDSSPVVSIPQKKGKSTPHLHTPPRKQKRTTLIDSNPTDGNNGRETSQIWDHFAKFIAKGGKRRAKCNYCVKHFAAETKTNGTSILWSHLNDKCLKSPFRFVDRRQTTLKSVPIKVGGKENGTRSIEKIVYNVEDIRRVIAEFVIIDEQPFKVVEGEVTLDNAFANDAAINHLKARTDDWKGVILRNEFLHVRCNAHILNIIVKEGLDEQIESISRITNALKYVKSSASRFASFKSYVEKVKLDTHGVLSLDVETRWNSTYTMLETAVNFEKAFARMYVDDHNYRKYCLQSELKGHPTTNDWQLVKDNVEGVLKRLYNHYNNSSTGTFTDNIGEKTKDFNILTWWKASSNRYPTISKMARDVLSIPVSTVAFESTFSTGGRILDSYRSSLSPKTVEALIYTQQWIRSPSKE